ncbi:hypothetical protein ACFE04_016821 [Oxalis oulophora]
MDTTNLNNSSNEEPNFEPYIGMQFDSLDDVTQFYKEFFRRKGFGVRIRSTKNNFRSMVCSNEGYHKVKVREKEEGENNEGGVKKKCSIARVGCTALLITSKGKNDEKWIVTKFDNTHNHPMVSPKSVSYLRYHKRIHILVIFQAKNIFKIPSQYVLHRWSKEAAREVRNFRNNATNANDEHLSGAFRSVHVSHQTTQLAAFAEKSEKIYTFIVNELDQISKVASSMEEEITTNTEVSILEPSSQTLFSDQLEMNELPQANIISPDKSNTKGRKKDSEKETQNKQFKSGLEISCEQSQKKKRKCKKCGELGHYQTSCKKNEMVT